MIKSYDDRSDNPKSPVTMTNLWKEKASFLFFVCSLYFLSAAASASSTDVDFKECYKTVIPDKKYCFSKSYVC